MDLEKTDLLVRDLVSCFGKCRCADCDCFVALLMEVQDLLDEKGVPRSPAREELDALVSAARKGPFHSCLGCDPCLPVAPYQDLLKVLGQAG